MTPIEKELSEIEKDASCDGTECDCCEHRILKLISFIRHQQEVIERKDEALEKAMGPVIAIYSDEECAEIHSYCEKILALKPRESLEDGE